MKLDLLNDHGGRNFAKAMGLAYKMGYDDGRQLQDKGKRIYPRKRGIAIAKELAARAHTEHAKFLQQAYAAGMWQCRQESES